MVREMRESAADTMAESRVVKAIISTEYSRLPEACKRVVSVAPAGFQDFANGSIVAAYRAAMANGGSIDAHLESDHVMLLEIYRTTKEAPVELDDVLADCRKIIRDAAVYRLQNAITQIESSPSQAFEILQGVAKEAEAAKSVASYRPIPWSELKKPVSYEGNLLGDRFLERGQGLILFGPAGCGKSVAGLQMCVEWSAGLDAFHIAPPRPLRIVIIQTEDSVDDTRETLAGIRSVSYISPAHQQLIEENLFILPAVPGSDPGKLVGIIQQSVESFKPDLVSVNPLLAFCPGDPARELGGILYQHVDPVIKACHIGFLGVHHTPKTNTRDTTGYGQHDYQYLAAGDARVANWPRAMILIEEQTPPLYKFTVAKRAKRSGWTWDQKPTHTRYFSHHAEVIRWTDSMPEEIEKAGTESYIRILSILPKSDSPGLSRERLRLVAKETFNVGKDKADAWLKLCIEDGRVERYEILNDANRKEALFRLREPGSTPPQDPF